MTSLIDSAEGSFKNPLVEDEVVTAVIEYLDQNTSAYSWDIISGVAADEQVSKKTVRKAVRKLRTQGRIIPSEPFVGELELST
jgi:methyl coenzyme M reductase subunit C